MPSPAPETEFYEVPENRELWRDVSRLYEDFCGENEELFASKSADFEVILNDVLGRLNQTVVQP
jgi:hypothetical protein